MRAAHGLLAAFVLAFALSPEANSQASPAAAAPGEGAPLFNDMGDHHCPVTTRSALAQRYFNQGLTLMYGFNHKEAGRSFREAARLDPECAMAYWGVAASLGPNINRPMPEEHTGDAWEALQQARRRMAGVSERERAYINALSRRYAQAPPKDRAGLDQAYAEGMGEVTRTYPEDLDAATLYAEALMTTIPWSYWTADKKPKPATVELLRALERVRAANPRHPGANHFYIHAVESGPDPRKGVAAADQLRGFAPGAGHLVHMPGHIYLRLGLYNEASQVNVDAMKADESYIAQCRAQGFYPLAYYPHNQHFFAHTTMMEGRAEDCLRHTRALVSRVTPDYMEANRLQPMLLFVLVRFNRWDDILKQPQPAAGEAFLRGISHYARGMAHAAQNRKEQARTEAKRLGEIVESKRGRELEQPNFYGLTQLRIAQELLRGEVARLEGDQEAQLRHLTGAVRLQDGLPYMEPPYWYYPSRHSLGAALLDAGRAAEAEAVYRKDLIDNPANGWSLFGLERSLRAQGKPTAADEVRRQFDHAWLRSDLQLLSSVACTPR